LLICAFTNFVKMKTKEKVLKRLKKSHWATWRHFKGEQKTEYENLLFDAYKLGEQDKLASVGKVIDDWLENNVRKCGNLFCVEIEGKIIRTDKYINIIELLVEEELKQKLGIKNGNI